MKIFNYFINRSNEFSPNQFQGLLMIDIPVVEDLLPLNNYCMIQVLRMETNVICELARQSLQKYKKKLRSYYKTITKSNM